MKIGLKFPAWCRNLKAPFIVLIFMILSTPQLVAQNEGRHVHPDGDWAELNGNDMPTGKCLPDDERARIQQRIDKAVSDMRADGLIARTFSRVVPPLLAWPLRQARGFEDNGYYAISNHVDLDPTVGQNNVLDYNGGTRTYDGHRGQDIRVYPYWWNKMADEQVEVIAAADGIIIFKQDGFEDNHCPGTNTGSWNAVYLLHADNSITWYGHMKSGTTTQKDSGDFVVAGEYLGIVGSSGNSTNPHLHLEVYDNLGNLIEPFVGPSNPTTNTSWWQNQLPYFDSGINRLTTHSTAPTIPACPGLEVINEKIAFQRDDPITFSVAFRHNLTTDSTQIRIFEPDGDMSDLLNLTYIRTGNFFTRNNNPFWNRTVADDAPYGKWTFQATYFNSNGTEVVTKNFWVGACNDDIILAGQHILDRYYSAGNSISSTADCPNNLEVIYDAANAITLSPGFKALSGSIMEMKIGGCIPPP